MLILGIDPGFDRLGWGVLQKQASQYSLVSCGIIQTDREQSHSQRLKQIYNELIKVIVKYSPQRTVIEKLFFATNAKTAISVAQARGVIVLACEQQGLEIIELTPLQIKSAVTGDGHADKRAVEKMVYLQLKNLPSKLLDDTLDAIAAALSV